jgi:hypothetical protein
MVTELVDVAAHHLAGGRAIRFIPVLVEPRVQCAIALKIDPIQAVRMGFHGPRVPIAAALQFGSEKRADRARPGVVRLQRDRRILDLDGRRVKDDHQPVDAQ